MGCRVVKIHQAVTVSVSVLFWLPRHRTHRTFPTRCAHNTWASRSLSSTHARTHTHTNTNIVTGLEVKLICYLLPFFANFIPFRRDRGNNWNWDINDNILETRTTFEEKKKRRRDMRKTWRQPVTSQMNSSFQETVCLIFSFQRRRYLTRCFNTNRKDDDSM